MTRKSRGGDEVDEKRKGSCRNMYMPANETCRYLGCCCCC